MNEPSVDLEYVNCPVCGPTSAAIWMSETNKSTRYLRCRTCRTVFASPRASRASRYKWLDDTYSVGKSAFENETRRRPALAVEARIIQRYVAGGAMLDVGCDTGAFFQHFPSSTWRRYGVEILPSAATYAGQTYAAQVYTGTIRDAVYPDAFFDLVTMIDMLYYVEDPCADLREAARILKPGGLLAIELAGQSYQFLRSRGLVSLILDHRWSRIHPDSAYLFWFDPPGLRRLLQENGFEVLGWHIVPTVEFSSRILTFLLSSYRVSLAWLSGWIPGTLTLAPKYLCLASPAKVVNFLCQTQEIFTQ